MIKFVANAGTGHEIVGLGLSRRNCERLLDDFPIRIDLRDLGLEQDTTIYLFAGEDEAAMAKEMSEFIGDDTIIHGRGLPNDKRNS